MSGRERVVETLPASALGRRIWLSWVSTGCTLSAVPRVTGMGEMGSEGATVTREYPAKP